MTDSTAPMHGEAAGNASRPCDHCRAVFTPRKAWARFCKKQCHDAFHTAEARKEKVRAAADDLYEAVIAARTLLRGNDLEHAWVNYPTEPALTLGALLDKAIAKAGYKPPKPTHPVLREVAETIEKVNRDADRRDEVTS